MPTDRPTAEELVAAVRAHLIDNVAPLLTGQPAFHLRVATNALAIIERTMAQGAALDHAELLRLRELVDQDGDSMDLNRTLAAQIRAGDRDPSNEALLAHLRQTAIDKLRLANPRYLTPRD